VWNYSIRPSLSNQLAAGRELFMQDFCGFGSQPQNPLDAGRPQHGRTLAGSPQIAINGFDSIGVTPTSGRNDISGHDRRHSFVDRGQASTAFSVWNIAARISTFTTTGVRAEPSTLAAAACWGRGPTIRL